MRFTVTRDEWFRGEGPDGSRLLLPDGRKCCLGFLGLECGLDERDILGKETFSMIDTHVDQTVLPGTLIERRPPGLIGYNETRLCDDIIEVNDDEEMSDDERESTLTRLFAEAGVEVTFE